MFLVKTDMKTNIKVYNGTFVFTNFKNGTVLIDNPFELFVELQREIVRNIESNLTVYISLFHNSKVTVDVDIGEYQGKQTKYNFKMFKHSFRTCKISEKANDMVGKVISSITKNLGWNARECPIKALVNSRKKHLGCFNST